MVFSLRRDVQQCFSTFFVAKYIFYIGKISRHITRQKCCKMTLCIGTNQLPVATRTDIAFSHVESSRAGCEGGTARARIAVVFR